MRARRIELALVLGVVFLGACRKSPAPDPTASAPPGEAAPAAPAGSPEQTSAPASVAVTDRLPLPARPILTVRVGTGHSDVDGLASGQSTFKPGEEVLAAVDVSTVPAGAVVKASWFDGGGGSRGEDQKTVPAGARWLTFTAPGAYNWPEGSFRVDVSANTGGFASASFQIVATTADDAANLPG